MSIKIGQIVKSFPENTSLLSIPNTFEEVSTFLTDLIEVKDIALKISFDFEKSYCFIFTFNKDLDNNFLITLRNNNNDEIPIKFFSKRMGTYQVAFSPKEGYDTLVFKKERITTDGASLPIEAFEINKFKIIELPSIENEIKNYSIIQLGIQAKPGTLFVINGEEIKIGRTGMYENFNNIIISKIAFYSDSINEVIILDFLYEEIEEDE